MKIKAFTLMELIVTLFVSSIIMAMGAIGLESTMSYFSGYTKNTKGIVDAMTFYTLLAREAEEAEMIKKVSDYEIQFLNKNRTDVNYLLLDNYVLRTRNNERDTFHLGIKNLEMNFQKAPAGRYEGIIDNLKLELFTENSFFIINKVYDAETLLQASNEALEL